MIEATTVDEILAQYEKHGWKLRRALLSRDTRDRLTKLDETVVVIDSDIDALWFSRVSNPASEAWELRRLSNLPFALVAVIPSDASDQERESTLAQIESDMRERTIA